MFGMSRHYLKQSTESSNTTWSIQNQKVQIIPRTSTLPDTAIVLSSKTGLVGTPEQTNEGIAAQTLLNPLIKVGAIVEINQREISEAQLVNTDAGAQVNDAPKIAADGQYRVIVAEYIGDNFGNDWYTNITCIAVDATTGNSAG